MITGPLPQFVVRNMVSLMRNSVLQTSMMLKKAFFLNPWVLGLGNILNACRMSVPVMKAVHCDKLSSGIRLNISGNDVLSGFGYWYLLSACQTPNNGHNSTWFWQMNVCAAEFIPNFNPAMLVTLFTSPLDNDKKTQKGRMTGNYRMSHTLHLLIKILFYQIYSTVSIHMPHKIFIYQLENSNLLLLACHFFIYVPPKSPTIWLSHWPQPINQHIITCLVLSPSKKNEQPDVLLDFLPNKNFLSLLSFR